LESLKNFENAPHFTERERVALRYTDAICWDPSSADDQMWKDLHAHFTEPELVELGSFIGYIAGGQRWIRTLGIEHGEVLADTTVGLSPSATKKIVAHTERDVGESMPTGVHLPAMLDSRPKRSTLDSPIEEHQITNIAALEHLYGAPAGAAVEKEIDHVHPHYQALIAASPFVVLATGGPDGLDTSPRGDAAGFVIVENEKTLLIPDRRGNNRVDSLRNIIANPYVALLFLIPGVGETLRVNGQAIISTDPTLLERFCIDGKLPRSVIVVRVDTVFFQCSRAIWRSKLWDPTQHIDRSSLPSLGTMIADISQSRINAENYDRGLYERLKAALY